MRIVYPYNEILPNKKAHDVFIFSEASKLAIEGFDVHMLCGRGSLQSQELAKHYKTTQSEKLWIEPLPILRKNNILNLSWNFPFFYCCQKKLKELKPDWVILSVRKQGCFHLRRKLASSRYLYEVHELSYYPNQKEISKSFAIERDMLSQADVVTVTTNALKEILLSPPYSLKVPIEVVPLGAHSFSLPSIAHRLPLVITYVGQLYSGQGLELLLKAMQSVNDISLNIVGGKQEEIERLKKLSLELGVEKKVSFLGFIPPAALEEALKNTHAFVAPFQNKGRMPYVAHTKLFEYAHTGRPFIAPDLPIVKEHFSQDKGTLLFEPENERSLADCFNKLKDRKTYDLLQKQMSGFKDAFSWEKRILRYKEILETL